MFWGQPWTAAWGAPDNTVQQLSFDRLPDGRTAVLHFTPAAGFGDVHLELYLQDARAAHFFAPEQTRVAVPLTLPARASFDGEPVGFALYGVGGWSFPPYSLRAVHLAATAADRGRRARLTWIAAPALDAVHGDTAGQLAGWSLTGVRRHANVARVPESTTRGRLYWTLQNSGSIRTVTLFSDAALTHPVAQGTRSGDGVITLTSQNASGLAGTVTVTYTADVPAGAWLDLRWPARYDLFSNGGSGALDFTEPFAVIRDTGHDDRFVWISRELTAGPWDFCLRTVSDTGKATANTAVQASLTVVLPPEPPGLPAYATGTAATGLTFSFTPSPTAGSTYRLYRSTTPGLTPDTSAPDATAAAGATQITSSAITGGAGTYSFLLVAINGSGESLNAQTVTCALNGAGAVLAPLPPAPMLFDPLIAERTVTARARFDPADAETGAAPAAFVDFYLVTETAAIDWTAPIASALPVLALNGWQTASAELPAQSTDGWYQLAARTRTAAGIRDSNSRVQWVHLSGTAPATTVPTAQLIR